MKFKVEIQGHGQGHFQGQILKFAKNESTFHTDQGAPKKFIDKIFFKVHVHGLPWPFCKKNGSDPI